MRVALCISGHLRKFDQTFHSLRQNFLQSHKSDIFIHTWDKLGFSCKFKTDSVLNNTNQKLTQIKSLYNPKNFIIEPSDFIETLKQEGDQYAPHLMYEPKHVGHMASMFYKIYACNELRKKYELDNVSYDYVIRCRADLVFESPIILPPKSENTIWIPRFISNTDWYTDQFAIGDSYSMDLYSSLYFDIPEYFEARLPFYPEKFMAWGLNKKNVTVNFIDTKFRILR